MRNWTPRFTIFGKRNLGRLCTDGFIWRRQSHWLAAREAQLIGEVEEAREVRRMGYHGNRTRTQAPLYLVRLKNDLFHVH